MVRWTLKELARTVGASMVHLRELVDKGVLRGSDTHVDEPLIYTPVSGRKKGPAVELIQPQAGPLWYSKRQVIDEYVRRNRANESGRFGELDDAPPNKTPKPSPKPPFGDGSSSSSSSSTSSSPSLRSGEGVAAQAPPAGADAPPPPPPKAGPSGKAKGDDPPPLTVDDLAAQGVDRQHAADWLKVRRDKGAKHLTPTAWAAVCREAGRAGISPAEAVRICAEREWRGFDASWDWQSAPRAAAAGRGPPAALQPSHSARHHGLDQLDHTEGLTADGRIIL